MAARYMESRYGDEDGPAEAIGNAAQRRGHLTKGDLKVLGRWKSPRILRLLSSNESKFVESVTKAALATSDEQLRIEILTLLRGVGWPMASVILHLAHPDPYPVLDFRALWSLQVEVPTSYDYPFWRDYVTFCRRKALDAQVTMRTLDRALWQYSKDNQPSVG